MLASPWPTPVTNPSFDIVATASLVDDHVTGVSIDEFSLSTTRALSWTVCATFSTWLNGEITIVSTSWVTVALSSQDQNEKVIIINRKIFFKYPSKYLLSVQNEPLNLPKRLKLFWLFPYPIWAFRAIEIWPNPVLASIRVDRDWFRKVITRLWIYIECRPYFFFHIDLISREITIMPPEYFSIFIN